MTTGHKDTSDPSAAASRRLTCARCGTAFDCGLGGDCWCAAEPYRLPLTTASVEDCLCPACLRCQAEGLTASQRKAD